MNHTGPALHCNFGWRVNQSLSLSILGPPPLSGYLNLTIAASASRLPTMFAYRFLPTNLKFSIPEEMEEFKCLILVEREIENDFRDDVSNLLVGSGCLYALAWGRNCSLWDDSIDYANLKEFNYGEIPEDKFVMTTWHENETLEDTIEFAKHCTDYSDVKLEDILVLDFGGQERGALIKGLYLRA